MIHAGDLVWTEREASCHRPVRQGGEKEAHTTGRGISVGELVEVLPFLQGTVGDRDILQISRKYADVRERRLTGSGRHPKEG